MRFALIAVLAFIGLARADVLPPPEEITEVQQALVGTWQQTALTGMRGHGEGMETMFFSKDRFIMVMMNALTTSNIYSMSESAGTWTGERISPTELKVTLTMGTPSPNYTPPTETLTVQITGPDTIVIPRNGFGPALVPYKRIYPVTAP